MLIQEDETYIALKLLNDNFKQKKNPTLKQAITLAVCQIKIICQGCREKLRKSGQLEKITEVNVLEKVSIERAKNYC